MCCLLGQDPSLYLEMDAGQADKVSEARAGGWGGGGNEFDPKMKKLPFLFMLAAPLFLVLHCYYWKKKMCVILKYVLYSERQWAGSI